MRSLGGNNGRNCNCSDDGEAKLMPDFVRGYRGAEEAEDCSLPVEFHETVGSPLNGELEVQQRTSYTLKSTVTGTIRGVLLVSSVLACL